MGRSKASIQPPKAIKTMEGSTTCGEITEETTMLHETVNMEEATGPRRSQRLKAVAMLRRTTVTEEVMILPTHPPELGVASRTRSHTVLNHETRIQELATASVVNDHRMEPLHRDCARSWMESADIALSRIREAQNKTSITHETTTTENARNDYTMGLSPIRRVKDGLASTEVALSRVRDAIGMISDHVIALMSDNPLPSKEKALQDDLGERKIDSEGDSEKQLGMLLEEAPSPATKEQTNAKPKDKTINFEVKETKTSPKQTKKQRKRRKRNKPQPQPLPKKSKKKPPSTEEEIKRREEEKKVIRKARNARRSARKAALREAREQENTARPSNDPQQPLPTFAKAANSVPLALNRLAGQQPPISVGGQHTQPAMEIQIPDMHNKLISAAGVTHQPLGPISPPGVTLLQPAYTVYPQGFGAAPYGFVTQYAAGYQPYMPGSSSDPTFVQYSKTFMHPHGYAFHTPLEQMNPLPYGHCLQPTMQNPYVAIGPKFVYGGKEWDRDGKVYTETTPDDHDIHSVADTISEAGDDCRISDQALPESDDNHDRFYKDARQGLPTVEEDPMEDVDFFPNILPALEIPTASTSINTSSESNSETPVFHFERSHLPLKTLILDQNSARTA